MNEGWICPRCGTSNAPFNATCVKCSEDGAVSLKQAKALTKKQKEVIEAMQKLGSEGKEVNGSSIGALIGISQSYASSILRKLIKIGYVGNEGYSYWLIKDTEGNLI